MSFVIGPAPSQTTRLDGVETPELYTTLRAEVEAIRDRVALSVQPHYAVLQFDEDAALDALDTTVATDLAVRDGQFRQALLLDERGRPRADLLVGYVRGTLIVLGTGLPPDELAEALAPGHAVKHLHTHHTLIGIDGPFAWELMAKWDSPGIIGLPYLGAFRVEDESIVIRAGRTGEFGYLLITPNAVAKLHWDKLNEHGAALHAVVVGQAALRHCALENWVFDIHQEGRAELDAMELQLRWRIDLHKEAPGIACLLAHRTEGLRRRLTAVDSAQEHAAGAIVRHDDEAIGRVVACTRDLFGAGFRILAVLDMPYAQSGINAYAIDGEPVLTRSAPWVLNRSLFVQPHQHEYALRDEISYPDGSRTPTDG